MQEVGPTPRIRLKLGHRVDSPGLLFSLFRRQVPDRQAYRTPFGVLLGVEPNACEDFRLVPE